MAESQKHSEEKSFINGKEYPAITVRIANAMLYKSKQSGKKLSWSGLAKEVGLTAQAPISWKKGNVSVDTLQEIAAFTGVEPLWLITGEGEMVKGHTNARAAGIAGATMLGGAMSFPLTPAIGAIVGAGLASIAELAHKKKEYAVLAEALKELEDNNENFEKDFKNQMNEIIHERINNVQNLITSKVKLVPVISLVEAGNFREAILNAQDEFIASYAGNISDDSFALEITGMSMFPDFKPGDKIICDPNIKPLPGECVIALNGNSEATFKKYKPRGYDENGKEYFELVPINPDYPTMNSKFQDIHIIGTVIEHFRSLRNIRH